MEKTSPIFQKYIFVCENEREIGDCCGAQGKELRDMLKEIVKQKGLSKKMESELRAKAATI